MIDCGKCGRMITCEKHKGYVYYHCANPECDNKWVREDFLTNIVLGRISVCIDQFLSSGEINEMLASQSSDVIPSLKKKREYLQRELTKIQKRIDNAFDEKIDGNLSDQKFREKSERWEDESATIQMTMKDLDQEIGYLRNQDQFSGPLKNCLRNFSLFTNLEKREFFNCFIDRWKLLDKKLFLEFKMPFSFHKKIS